MLISPLMGSILGIGYGLARYDSTYIRSSAGSLLAQVLISVATSALYFSLTPIATPSSELLARTSPTIWDVLIAVFGEIPFPAEGFRLVLFAPPHLCRAGKSSWLGIKYGVLESTWQNDLRRGFEECMRVLHPYGVLIFKWSEDQINTADVLKLLPVRPLFGNRRGKAIWMCFMKFPEEESK